MEERPLRSGFTTGTCTAAAAGAAAVYLLTAEIKTKIDILTPKGVYASLQVEYMPDGWFRVQKDAGDDPDVTHGAWIYGMVERCNQRVEPSWYRSEQYPHLYLTGGEGIGVVTRAGLACPVGKHAINPVPRKMIYQAVEAVCEEEGYQEDLLIRLKIPEGVSLAEQTFNPKLGIVGGISVLGTSGVVEPMSEQALLDTIKLELHMKVIEGVREVILTPGNYGEAFLQEHLKLSLKHAVKCSNFIGDTLGLAEEEGVSTILFVGHIGKLIKVAGGVFNTHSKYGDRRMEILNDCVEAVRENEECNKYNLGVKILQSISTEEALGYLSEAGCLNKVMEEVVKRICHELSVWCHGNIQIEVVTFSSVYGILGKSQGAEALIKKLALEET